MALKSFVASLDGVPEPLHAFYQPTQGGFVLDAEIQDHPAVKGLASKKDELLSELKQAKEGLARFKDVDPDLFAKLKSEHDSKRDKKLLDEGKVEELIQERISAYKQSTEAEKAEILKQLEALQGELAVERIDKAVASEAIKLGIRETALDDVLLRAKTTFKLKDGHVYAERDGKPVTSAKDPQKSLGISEWLGGLESTAPHLFNPSKGSGAAQGKPGTGVRQSISRADFNNLAPVARQDFVKSGGAVTE